MTKDTLLTTFQELQERRELLERSMELNKFNTKRAFSDAGSELPKFLLQKVAIPAALIAAVAIGVDKLIQNNSNDEQVYQAQAEEDNGSTSLLTKAWLFALPIIQPYIKSFIREQISNRFDNSNR